MPPNQHASPSSMQASPPRTTSPASAGAAGAHPVAGAAGAIALKPSHPPASKPSNAPAPKSSRRGAFLAAAAVLAAFAFFGWRLHRHYLKNNPPPPPPLENVLPVIPKDQEKQIRSAVKLGARTLLKVTPEQEKRMDALWERPPRSLDELVEFNKKVDVILTPEQRERARPLRRMLRHAVIDRMLDGGKKRLSPKDFEKFKNEIKARVDRRIEGS